MNKLIYCITSVNADVFNGIKNGIKHLFCMRFYRDNARFFGVVGIVISMIVGYMSAMVLGIYVADEYYPGNLTARLCLPISFLWSAFLITIYVAALFKKCKNIS